MKRKKEKSFIVILLCMVLVLSGVMSASAEEQEIKQSEAIQLKQLVNNSDGKTMTVIADIPQGAFEATASEIEMEAAPVQTEEETITELMKNAMPEHTSLSNYVMCNVTFKVNGIPTEPKKAISIHLQGMDLKAENAKNATTFYYNPAESNEGNKDPELIVIAQKSGMDTVSENSDEDYDYSEIMLNKDGMVTDIRMNIRKNRIYGCFVTEEAKEEEQKEEGNAADTEFQTSRKIETQENTLNTEEICTYDAIPSEDAFLYQKYIKRNSDGTYNITLNVAKQTDNTNSICSNIRITDQLSEYVDTTDNSRLKVKIAEKSGESYTDQYEQEFSLSNENDVIWNGKKIATVSYDSENKTANLIFTTDYALEKDDYYYLSMTNVVPNMDAFDDYEVYGYETTKGDPSTDEENGGYTAKNTGTSSGQPGFKANEIAYLSYTYNGQPATKYYAHPVVQVETIQVEKKWIGSFNSSDSILVQLLDKNGQPVAGRTIELNAANQWKGRFIVEKADNYSVGELTSGDDGTHCVVNGGGETKINGITYRVSYTKNKDSTWIVTNTAQAQRVKIIKQSTSGENLKDAEFDITDGDGKKTTYISTDGGIVFDNGLPYGTYTLEEIRAPGGYIKLSENITINVTESKVEVTGSSKASCTKNNTGVYEIVIKNEILSNLPDTGGSGSSRYLLGGMILMLISVWIYMKNEETTIGEQRE